MAQIYINIKTDTPLRFYKIVWIKVVIDNDVVWGGVLVIFLLFRT